METVSRKPPSPRKQQLTSSVQAQPKDIVAFMYLPDKTFFFVSLEVRNRLGDLAAVSQILSDSKIHILSASFSRGRGGKPGSCQLFVGPEDVKLTADELTRLLLSCPDVLSCQTKSSHDGFLVDSLTFPLRLSSGQRTILIRNDVWNGMMQKTREKFGTGGDVIIYDQGLMAGKMVGKELLYALGKERVVKNSGQIVTLYQALGWGRAKLLNLTLSPLNMSIRLWESAECTNQNSETPTGHFMRGQMVGITEELFGVETKCSETSCVAMGHDFCEFVIDEKGPLVRNQLSFDQKEK